MKGDLLKLAAITPLHRVVRGHNPQVNDSKFWNKLHIIVSGKDTLVLSFVLLHFKHELMNVKGQHLPGRGSGK